MSKKSKVKEAIILLIDIGQNVSHQDEDGKSFLQKSKHCASKIIQRKIFSDTSDEFNIVLIGSKTTCNELDYPNIHVMNDWFTMPNWKMLKTIENLSSTELNNGDWLDGIIVAINLLKNESECKTFSTLKIVMMSNFTTPFRTQDQVDDVIVSLQELQINLVVIGTMSEEIENYGEDQMEISNDESKGIAAITRIVNEAEGVMCSFEEAMAQLDHFQKIEGRAAAWNCNLKIGQKISIPITGFKKFASKLPLRWKKRSIYQMPIFREIVYFEGDKQVEKTDVIHSYLFGRTVVPISEDDKMSMTLSTEKCFQVIGFTKKKNTPRHIFLSGSVHYIVPRKDVKGAKSAVTGLVKELLAHGMVAIVRKVYSKNTSPHLGALIPTCEKGCYFFYFVPLPFAEDERLIKLPSLKSVKPSKEQLDAVDNLIDDMDLSQFDEDEDPYTKLVKPSVEHINNSIVFKALNPNCKLPDEPVDVVKNLLRPMPEILENASSTLEIIKNIFCLEEIEQKRYRKGAADIFDRTLTNGDITVEEDVKPKDLASAMTSFVQSTITEIGTVDPEGNFLKLLESGVPFTTLCEQMQSAIKKLFLISSTGVQKPLSALLLLRKQCLAQNPYSYNQFIASLKDDFVGRGLDEFWESVVREKLGLITSEETKESNVTPDEADTFYQIKKNESEQDLNNYEMEAEELLDML